MFTSNEYYVVNTFIPHTVSTNQTALQHRRGIVLISDKGLITSIPLLKEMIGRPMLLEEIQTLFKSKSESYIKFLIENKIIQKKIFPNFDIENINFFSNHEGIQDLIDKSYFENHQYTSYKNSNSFVQKVIESKNEVFLIFLNPYNRELAQEIRNSLTTNETSLSIFSYIYSGRLYIESLYSPSWKNPCHVCQFSHIESELRYGAAHGITYQQIIDYLYTENKNFSISTPLDFVDILNIASQLVNRFDLLLALNSPKYLTIEEFTKGIVMDIDSKEVQRDTTFHWELCDCYD